MLRGPMAGQYRDGAVREPRNVVGNSLAIDPGGRWLYTGYEDIYQRGIELFMNPDGRIWDTPQYGSIDLLMIYDLSDPLKGAALGALVVGLTTYLLGHVVFKYLVSRELSSARLGAAIVLLAAWLPLREVPALGQLGVALLVVAVALGTEAVVHRDRRREIRGGAR